MSTAPKPSMPSPMDIEEMASLKSWGKLPETARNAMQANVSTDCGWGRVVFAQTFESAEDVAAAMRAERPRQRDIALYVRDPHLVLAAAPQELFLDPSHTYRLDLGRYQGSSRPLEGFKIKQEIDRADQEDINRIYRSHGMVPAHPDFFSPQRNNSVTMLTAVDSQSGGIAGVVTIVDHKLAFGDPDNGSSLWSLAVDRQCPYPGVGEALVRAVIGYVQNAGRAFLDLSVMHDNEQAIALYSKLGFERVPVLCVKRKNEINEKLFIGKQPARKLNPYAELIVNEAMRRGINVQVDDAEGGFFTLSLGGRAVTCRESLSELTSAVALSRCDDKAVTRRFLAKAGLRVPEQIEALDNEDEPVTQFLAEHERVVVKPARGEQGRGISVDLTTLEDVKHAAATARHFCDRVLLEEMVAGDDLRIIVIDYRVIAAAIRKPAQIVGDGQKTVRELIEQRSRRRARATGGESRIPLDAETERCVGMAGYEMADVPDKDKTVAVRKTANLHTGGTIHDVTDHLHPVLINAAIKAAKALSIPVVGLDFLVGSVTKPDYVVIEANERPGLANHEPQPTAERFVDLLFPQTRLQPLFGS
ncbi:MAG: N-acetylglutaminylglutamine synthetase [Pseudomonadota bacterium]